MNKELYFLRSSEQKIVTDLFAHAHPNQEELREQYTGFYGLTRKDLGLYAMVDGRIAGAIWSRRFDGDGVATLSVAILPEFKKEGIGSFMMEQFLQEAATHLDELRIDISAKPMSRKFYENFGFYADGDETLLTKHLERQEIVRPTDGYDASRWMD
ncbi:MAG: GNAT family N-acetyltransferase [Campylobacterales bacterium]|nr:GNAT family N-acetyltransferase [Campylobacterales bacterium]